MSRILFSLIVVAGLAACSTAPPQRAAVVTSPMPTVVVMGAPMAPATVWCYDPWLGSCGR
ncbi:hypothetical protein [Ramlibacter albus]|uniref:Uncharacterized protein n=1 Tax=Ramlibacter albus TaxID=2079448 RepID=A0A923M856_9BURK|nr:hypothetical protein [Ramlibacter albus]MBC5765603.1 hypothetical protein [Ramlibacter albus]